MMNEKVMLLSLEKQTFKNKDTGEVREMLKVTYGVSLINSDDFVGYTVMTSYAKIGCFGALSKVLKKELDGTIEIKPGEKSNSVKYTLSKVNGTSIVN